MGSTSGTTPMRSPPPSARRTGRSRLSPHDVGNGGDAIPAAQRSKYGTIVHKSVRSVKSGSGEGVLETTEDWVTPDNRPILREDTRYVFGASLGARTIQRITTLTALDSAAAGSGTTEEPRWA